MFDRRLYLPFRADRPIEYETIQWQIDPSSTSRCLPQTLSPNRILQPRNEQLTCNAVDDQNYLDVNGADENEAPKVIKKKGRKKKQQAKIFECQNHDNSIQLNISSSRTSTNGQKFPVKYSIELDSDCSCFLFSKNYHRNGRLVNVFRVLLQEKPAPFGK